MFTGPEQLIAARQELRVRIDVAQLGQPFDVVDRRAADQAADRLGEEQIALQIGGQPIAADDRRAGRRGEVIQVLRRHARAAGCRPACRRCRATARRRRSPSRTRSPSPAGSSDWAAAAAAAGADAGDAAGGRRARRERAVVNRELEVHRAAFAARIHEPRLPVVVRRQAPLPAVRARSARAGSRTASSGCGTGCRSCRSSCPCSRADPPSGARCSGRRSGRCR